MGLLHWPGESLELPHWAGEGMELQNWAREGMGPPHLAEAMKLSHWPAEDNGLILVTGLFDQWSES